MNVSVKDYHKRLVLPVFVYKTEAMVKQKEKARVFFFVEYFEGNWVSSSSSDCCGWLRKAVTEIHTEKCWNTLVSWWRHLSWILQVFQWKTNDPNAYFSLNTLQPFHTGIVLITSYSLSSMTNACHVVFVHSLSVHEWRSLLQCYAGWFLYYYLVCVTVHSGHKTW